MDTLTHKKMHSFRLSLVLGALVLCYNAASGSPIWNLIRGKRQLDRKLMEHFKLENETCKVTEWSEWGPCHGSDECPERQFKRDAEENLNFQMEAAEGFDKGRAAMEYLMEAQKEEFKDFSHCSTLNECPEYEIPKSQGEFPCVNGLSGRYPCRNMHQLAFINTDDLGAVSNMDNPYVPRGNDMWGWYDEATGDEYAIMGLSTGTSFIRVTDPTKPEVLGYIKSHTSDSIWRDIKVVNDVAFIVSEAKNHGMQLFDLRRLRDRAADDFENFEPDYRVADFGKSHNVVSNEESQYIYVVGATTETSTERFINGSFEYGFEEIRYMACKGGMIVYDVSSRLHPVLVGCFHQDGYCHDAQCVTYHGPDNRYQDRELCFMYNEDSLTIVDVTEKGSMYIVSKNGYYGSAYTHQGWLTEDQRYVLMDDELDETKFAQREDSGNTRTFIWDVSDLESPILRHIHVSSEHSIDHNLYTKGDFVYESNYAAGLRVEYFDPLTLHMKEVAYFGVHPMSEENPVFKGTWSNYPYFRSGAVGVTSKEFGLFMVQPDYETMKAETALTYGEQRRYRRILHLTNVELCPNVIDTRTCDPGCHDYDIL